jgi:acetyltransferase-like isoleucine patch superfamily enzyme
MSFAQAIKANPTLKKFIHWCLIPSNLSRPRKWVTWCINPFYHNIGKGVTICRRTRIDVIPFQPFNIGDYSTIEDFATVNNGIGPVNIGKHTIVGIGNVIIGPVTIGNNVILAQNIVVSGLNHDYTNIELPIYLQKQITRLITIEDDCWIGANVVITAGITIGKHAVVAGGAVVTKDIPPFSVAVGNPARVVKLYNPDTRQWEKI